MRALVLACLFVFAFAGVAHGAPADRASAMEAFLDLMDATRVPSGWTGSVDGCVVGTESAASLEATLAGVNVLRDFAGLGPVAFDPALNQKALAAALMMKAKGALSHFPDAAWPCYSEDGKVGAASSNLALGISGAGAMIGYVDDAGVPSLGHRRWLLGPGAGTFGSGSTGTTNALYVFGANATEPVIPEVVSWPPAGHVPWSLVFGDWSAAITVPGATNIDLSSATVAVTVGARTAVVSGKTVLPAGYGTGPALSWKVDVTAAERAADQHVEVDIGNVVVDGGAPRSFHYELDAFRADPPAPTEATGSRTADAVTVEWEAATERGVPITGYRIWGVDLDYKTLFDVTVGPELRKHVEPFKSADYVYVHVVPVSRAGSPLVTPFPVAPPPAPPKTTTTTTTGDGGGGGSTTTTTTTKPPVVTPARVPAGLVVRPVKIVGKRLSLTASLTPLADGESVRVRISARRAKPVVRTAVIRGGVARFNVKLPKRHLRARRLKVAVYYAGSAWIEPAARAFTFRR